VLVRSGRQGGADEQTALRVCLLEDNLPSASRRDNSGFDLDTAKVVAEAMGRPLVRSG